MSFAQAPAASGQGRVTPALALVKATPTRNMRACAALMEAMGFAHGFLTVSDHAEALQRPGGGDHLAPGSPRWRPGRCLGEPAKTIRFRRRRHPLRIALRFEGCGSAG